MSKRRSIAFFEAGTRNLLAVGADAGVTHHVILSIVGVDLVDLGYYRGKRRQEELALASGGPVSILRSTQFHEFAGQLLDRSRGPIAIVPQMLVQPVAAREVAAALVAVLASDPLGMAPQLGGPEELELVPMARAVRTARRSRQVILPVPLPSGARHAVAGGAQLLHGDAPRGRQTFAEWLADASPSTR